MTQPSYIDWNICSCRFYHARQVDWRTVRLKISNSRSEGEVVLLTVDGCDSSKVFPSDSQHIQRCCLLTRKEGVEKGRP
ncbi:unnamed protein product [Schistosoma curassoni]|uniref:Alpha-mannosidase n=1 Tax=Schistosoma curassoni TaxID=6186 RepID=A0A183K9B7_9TREM|nr:unnamed protein product [Schistosoma curassoni]